ncbi:DUF6223 family protein [Gordonia sp. PP30]|uniref:DUF6223 family protein n=1 Tax=unclassified Gordonia (in: high G+C Gram-positive bacteria) TaxID=2657482 RepID=UPI001FFE2F07|nr:DUF6223 family protein [Gordonia sp. PP30]UQE76860.1 DUF6223 family protein [Gordonia sp. PP30]
MTADSSTAVANRNLATVAAILGIASVALFWIPIVAPFVGLVAIVLGFLSREKITRSGQSTYLGAAHIAIVTGIIGVIIGVVLVALSFGFGPA